MGITRLSRWRVVCGPLVLSLLLIGCARPAAEKPPPDAQVHIMKIVSLWGGYRREHQNKAPKNAEELKAWAKKLKPDALARYGVSDLDEALVSPRDHEPYGVLPIKGKSMQAMMAPVVIYERAGVNGKHMTASAMGTSGELTTANLRSHVPDL